MDNELRNHKKSDTFKWWLTLIAFLLMGATILGMVTGFIVPNQNKQNEDIPTTEQTENVEPNNEYNTEFVNGVLNITTVKPIDSYHEKMSRIDGGRARNYENKFKEYANEDAYSYIRFDQPDSGLSELMKINFDATVVTGVETNKTQILF